jgi:integrase
MKKELHYLSFDEWERLISSLSDFRDMLILRLLYETGCTVNELVNIRISDVDPQHLTVRIHAEHSRNHEFREAAISARLCSMIKDYTRGRRSLFVLSTRQSDSMTTKRIRQIVEWHCTNIGLRHKNPQILRYTHIAHAYMKNIPIDAIQRQVGLKRSRAIEVFNHLKIEAPKDAYRRFLE